MWPPKLGGCGPPLALCWCIFAKNDHIYQFSGHKTGFLTFKHEHFIEVSHGNLFPDIRMVSTAIFFEIRGVKGPKRGYFDRKPVFFTILMMSKPLYWPETWTKWPNGVLNQYSELLSCFFKELEPVCGVLWPKKGGQSSKIGIFQHKGCTWTSVLTWIPERMTNWHTKTDFLNNYAGFFKS